MSITTKENTTCTQSRRFIVIVGAPLPYIVAYSSLSTEQPRPQTLRALGLKLPFNAADPSPAPLADVSPQRREVPGRGYANLVELRQGEVRRILLPGTRLNRSERKGRDPCS